MFKLGQRTLHQNGMHMLQNPSVKKTLSIMVIDGSTGFGNGCLLPAGPLREPAFTGFNKVDVFILLGEDKRKIMKILPPAKPMIRARISIPAGWAPDKKSAFIAFSGLGWPEKFRNTILEQGLTLAGWHEFPDHHIYTSEELRVLDEEAERKSARLLTTEKDAIRLPAEFAFKSPFDVMPVEISWEDENALHCLLTERLGR